MHVDTEPNKVEELVQALISNLTNQEHNMDALKQHIDEQLSALRSQERSTLEQLTAETSGIVSTLQQLQNEKDNHIQLFSELLGLDIKLTTIETIIQKLQDDQADEQLIQNLKQLFKRIPERAQAIRDSSKELAYSLQFALHLGHQMIEAIQGAVSYPPILIYTAEGSKKLSASKRMMVNKVG